MSLLLITPPGVFASSHREAPITALDHAADITDFYAFVSYDHPDRVTFIMNVDPFLEPSNGPNYFPFDPNVLYQIKIDNNHDALADMTFNIQFQTQIRAPQLFTGFAGAGNGINARQELACASGSGNTDCSASDYLARWSRVSRFEPAPDLHRDHVPRFQERFLLPR